MKNIVIIYYSQTGNTEALARGVALGVESEDIQATLKKVGETTNDDLIKADAIIVGSPVYFGSMAAPIKKMFDQSVAIRRQLKDKIGAAFVTAGHHSGGKERRIPCFSIFPSLANHYQVMENKFRKINKNQI